MVATGFRWHLSTPVEETRDRISRFAAANGCKALVSRRGSRVALVRDEGYGFGQRVRRHLLTTVVQADGERSVITVRGRADPWVKLGGVVWLGMVVAWFATAARLPDVFSRVFAAMIVLLLVGAPLLHVYIRERSEAVSVAAALAAALADVRYLPPPREGPYR